MKKAASYPALRAFVPRNRQMGPDRHTTLALGFAASKLSAKLSNERRVFDDIVTFLEAHNARAMVGLLWVLPS
jgi:hypothetical protein